MRSRRPSLGFLAAIAIAVRIASPLGTAAAQPVPGHPPVDGAAEAPSIAGMREPIPDTSEPDPSLPHGTLVVELRDADDRPLPGRAFTLGVVRQSIAQGDKRERQEHRTNAEGFVRIDGLATESAVAYRVSAQEGPATFAATPFRMPDGAGHRVRLHVASVTTDPDRALLAMQVVALVDVKDDRVIVQQAIVAYNFGASAWFADDVPLALPKGATALSAQASMSDRTLTLEGGAAKLRGTFPPGETTLEYQWQVPYGETSSVDLTVGLPPHVAAARAMAVAGTGQTLRADGFTEAQEGADGRGQRMLVAERTFKRTEAPATSMTLHVGGLPVPGPARWVAAGIALSAALGAVFWALRARRGAAPTRSPAELERLASEEARALAAARASGEVGPETFEAERRRLVETLARALSA
jgi:hypothetical protein